MIFPRKFLLCSPCSVPLRTSAAVIDMTIVCWTVLHGAGARVPHGAPPVAHAIRRIARRAHRVPIAHPTSWAQVVCKVLPAAAVGGILGPIPLMPPHPPDPPPAYIQPAPAITPGPIWFPAIDHPPVPANQ